MYRVSQKRFMIVILYRKGLFEIKPHIVFYFFSTERESSSFFNPLGKNTKSILKSQKLDPNEWFYKVI